VTGLDGPYLLYAARLEHPHKNHLRLLRAYAASAARRTHRLALSGSDWGAGPLVLEERARLGLEDRVRILGFLERDMVPPLFAGADGVIMVGLHEGFGLPALEALACGRPVCASSTGALPEVVGPLGAICDPMDESSIAASLDRLVGDAALRARCAEEGPAWAAARGWERTVAGLIEACGAAANGGATRRG